MTDQASSRFEKLDARSERILAAMLAASFPGRDEIARQVETVRARALDLDGSLDFMPSDAAPAKVARRIPVEAEAEDVDGMTYHVLLHVVDGYINELEVYRNDGLRMQRPVRPEALRVIVL